jgi:hypothetical protein
MPAKSSPSSPATEVLAAAVSRFGAAVGPKLRKKVGGPEEQLREPFSRLLAEVGMVLGVDILTVGETPLQTLGVRPDYMVDVGGARVGYVELKAPGRKVPTTWTPTKREQEQWDKLKLLPNVLYTDGMQWAVYRFGELVGRVAQLDGDLRYADAKLAPLDGAFERVVSDFLLWKPDPPRTVGQLVRAVANLCRLLRGEIADTLDRERSGAEPDAIFTGLAEDWRTFLFPGLSDGEFADAYAQTVTFALLLARVDGIVFEGRPLAEIARLLGKNHSLMGKALNVLTEQTLEGRSVVVTTLLRVISAVDWDALSDGSADTYLHLYEHFLEEYDQELRKQSGSYYTPNEVVAFMVGFVEEILRTRMGKAWGLAADDVMIVDPAMGTGTYLLSIIDSVARTVEAEEGPAAVGPQLRALFGRLIGFEKQTGPYAVAELRVHQALKAEHHTEIPAKEVQFFVADTLDNPYIEQTYIPSMLEPIARSRREANKIKRETPVLVVIGNPPYGNQAKGRGGWIEQGNPEAAQPAPLRSFRAAGNGGLEYVLSDLYVYFWRWGTWKVFDAHPDQPSGVIAFITPSSYTTGPGYAGMREYLRRAADEGWIIDVSPEGHQPEVNTRLFTGVQNPLCISIFVRYGPGDPTKPARIHHLAVSGRREEKLARLGEIALDSPQWADCGTGWQDRLTPAADVTWMTYPQLGDLFPWHAPGVKPNRTWVYSPDADILKRRWARLTAAPPAEKRVLFKENDTRTIDSVVKPVPGLSEHKETLLHEHGPCPTPVRVAYRAFDRQWVIPDLRVQDRPRPDLWRVRGATQMFVIEQHAQPLTAGPGLLFSAHIPDMDHFMGHHGGRVLPLYRDSAGLMPNLAPGLSKAFSQRLGTAPGAEDLLAYVACVAAHSGFTARFSEELKTPGVRVPLTADPDLWSEAVRIGREVLWLHTYGERLSAGRPSGAPKLPQGQRPKAVVVIPDTPDGMPEKITYDPETETLHVGSGEIRPVSSEVWEYEVSGMKVVKKWFDYRRTNPSGRRSSPLDDLNPDRWPAKFTTELLELLNVLGRCVDLEPQQAGLLDRICQGSLVSVADLEQAGVLPVPDRVRKALPPDDSNTMF